MPAVSETRKIVYDDGVVRGFVFWSVLWGTMGLLVGLLAALQLTFRGLNFDLPFLTFSRIRPLHTNAVIFALVGNMMFAGIYYSSQRLLKVRMASDLLSRIHLWGWQVIILGAALTLPFGLTQGREYAELEWFLDILVVLVWAVFGVNFFLTLARRNEQHLYVALWFYIATIIAIALLYIVNNLSLPVSWGKSYVIWSGAQDALTQWWYGHNSVAFFLTMPIIGIMYYFLPRAAGRPVYSYRLAIIHFWALVFIYTWAGPHHLLNTALPEWAQTLGMLFSLMLWAPSWGGTLNWLLTMRGAWHKLRTDPVLKFFVAGMIFYGISTVEGPLLSIREVSALAHYTDWIIGHVHGGALGWNGFMAAGMFYWLVPRLFGTRLASTRLADTHFWIGLFGILLYVASMWIGGITQGLMWRAETAEGTLQYPFWVAIIQQTQLLYVIRAIGGAIFILGWFLMIVNLIATVRAGKAVDGEVEVEALREQPATQAATSGWSLFFGRPLILSFIGLTTAFMFASSNAILAVVGLVLLAAVCVWAAFLLKQSMGTGTPRWHEMIEQRPLVFALLVLVVVVVGGVIELVPGLVIDRRVPVTPAGKAVVYPYTPLELAGRDMYVREGCYNCHSQMIRPLREEKLRYGDPSLIEESMFDHPFQWGSKRTGPDLARIGDKNNKVNYKSDNWHYRHLMNPPDMVEHTIMPGFPWLAEGRIDPDEMAHRVRAHKKLGVPYRDEDVAAAAELYRRQAEPLAASIGFDVAWDAEIVALIAYLQRLGAEPGIEIGIDEAALDRNGAAGGADGGSK